MHINTPNADFFNIYYIVAYWEKTKKYILKIYCEFGLIYKKDGVRCQNTYYSYIFNNLGQIYSRPNLQKNTKKGIIVHFAEKSSKTSQSFSQK